MADPVLSYVPSDPPDKQLQSMRWMTPLELVSLAHLALNEAGTKLRDQRPPVYYQINRLTHEVEDASNTLREVLRG